MRVHADARRTAYCDLFPEGTPTGDVNVFVFHKGARTYWHRHQRQTDHFVVVSGHLVVRTTEGAGDFIVTYHLRTGDQVVIEPNRWHGYECEEEGTVLVMYLDKKYDPTDEERAPEDAFDFDV